MPARRRSDARTAGARRPCGLPPQGGHSPFAALLQSRRGNRLRDGADCRHSGYARLGKPRNSHRALESFRGDAAWTDSRAAAFAATSELWRRDSHTGSAFVTVSTAASIMGPFFTLPRRSLRMRLTSMAKHATTPGGFSVPAAARPFSHPPHTKLQ